MKSHPFDIKKTGRSTRTCDLNAASMQLCLPAFLYPIHR